jgi:signal transduction histidine kinase
VATQPDVLRQLDRLRVEVEALRASRRQLVLSADDDRRRIERDLHDGVHQQFVALAVGLQLLDQALGSDPAAAPGLVEELRRDVQRGLEETVALAQRIYPATLEARDLAALLRSAAVDAGVAASVEVEAGADHPPEVVMTVYLCWLSALACARNETPVTITVRELPGALVFDVTGNQHQEVDFERVRLRVEALGGMLTLESGQDGRRQIRGALPFWR